MRNNKALFSPLPPKAPIKNILIRHSCFNEIKFDDKSEHPENSHLLKYAPKYYHSFIIQIQRSRPLLSKIKTIKKLKKLEKPKRFAEYFPRALSHKHWFHILASNRKEIEEIPYLPVASFDPPLSQLFWHKFVKSFPNLKRVCRDEFAYPLRRKKAFSRHVWNMRKLKVLRILVNHRNYDEVKCFIEKLNGMSGLLQRLETLHVDIQTCHQKLRQKLFRDNENVFSHLTGLKLTIKFLPLLGKVPQLCKNLKSLSLEFQNEIKEQAKFQKFLTSLQHLSQLQSLEFDFPKNETFLWEYFKPQSSLRSLKIRLYVSRYLKEELSVGHWEEIPELDFLELHLRSKKAEVQLLVTMILKKIRRLRSLKLSICCESISENILKYEPFFMAEVPHLYESLEQFEFALYNSHIASSKFDLKTLKPFCNLKHLRLESKGALYENVKEAVNLLQENQRRGDYPALEFKLRGMTDHHWLVDFLRTIQNTKRVEKNLKVLIDFSIKNLNFIDFLEKLCQSIRGTTPVKGLRIHLESSSDKHYAYLPTEKVMELLDKNPDIKNLTFYSETPLEFLNYVKLDGRKTQFYGDRYAGIFYENNN